MQKTVLVTGAGGFIGLNVVKEYAKHNWKILAIVHNKIPHELYEINNIEIIKGDVTNKDFMMQFAQSVDVVAHIAGLAADIGCDSKFRKLNLNLLNIFPKFQKKNLFMFLQVMYME